MQLTKSNSYNLTVVFLIDTVVRQCLPYRSYHTYCLNKWRNPYVCVLSQLIILSTEKAAEKCCRIGLWHVVRFFQMHCRWCDSKLLLFLVQQKNENMLQPLLQACGEMFTWHFNKIKSLVTYLKRNKPYTNQRWQKVHYIIKWGDNAVIKLKSVFPVIWFDILHQHKTASLLCLISLKTLCNNLVSTNVKIHFKPLDALLGSWHHCRQKNE